MSDEIAVITNHVPRDIIDAWNLTPAEREQFDYIDWSTLKRMDELREECQEARRLGRDPQRQLCEIVDLQDDCQMPDGQFFRYKGRLYDIGEFSTTSVLPEFNPLYKWDAYHNDSFFSGILIRYPRESWGDIDSDHIIVGRFCA